jgi:hypothetical protein
MHYLTLVVIPENGDVAKHVDTVMNQRAVKSVLGWDWFQIGGRWSGLFSGYDPDTDPKNIKTCELCGGTGTRRDMRVANGCNGCEGKGRRPVWPTERVEHDGDVLTTAEALAQLTPERVPYAIATNGKCSETESWNGKDFVKNPEHEATVRMMLAQPGRCVVVDYHS